MSKVTATPIVPITSLSIGNSASHVAYEIEYRATRLLESHPNFQGRSQWIHCRYSNGLLNVSGKLPSFYLKQIAQEVLRELEGVDQIENRIVVASPVGEIRCSGNSFAANQPQIADQSIPCQPR